MSAIDSQKTQTVLSESDYFCCLLCGCSLLIQPSCGNRINLFGRSSQINVVNEIKQLNISELQHLEQVVSPPFICQNKCYRSLIKLSNLRRKVKRLTEDFEYTFKEAEGKRPIRFKRPGSEDDLVIYPRAVKTSRLSSPACNSASSSKTTQDYKIKAAEDIARSLHLANFVSIAPRILPTTTNGLSTAAVRPPDMNTSHQTLTERQGIKHLEEHGNNKQPFFVTQKDSIQQAVTQMQPSSWISEQRAIVDNSNVHSAYGTPGQSHPTVTQVQSESDVTRTHEQSHPTLTQIQPEPGAQGQSYSTVQTQPVTWTHRQSLPTPTQASVQLGEQEQVVYAVHARTEPQAVLDNIGQSQLLKQTELLLSGSPSQVSNNISAASSVMAIPVVLSVVPPNTQDHNFTKVANSVTQHNNLQQPPSSVFLKVANSTINTGNPVQLSQMAHLNQPASNVRPQATCFTGPFQAHCNPQPKEKERKEGVWITVFYPSYKKKKRLSTNLEPLGKALLRGTYEQIAAAAFKSPLIRRFLDEHFIREVGKQCDTLRSTKAKSLLRKYSDEDMMDFSFEKLCLEWRERTPLFYHVLMNCANTLHGNHGALDWIPSVALAGSVLLRERNKDMCAMALLVSRIIRDSPNKEVAFDRLSKMQLTFVGNRGFSFRDDMDFFNRYDQEVEDFKQKKLLLSKEKKGAGKTMVERRKESTGSGQGSEEVNDVTADEGNVVSVMGNEGCEDEVNTGKGLDIPSQTEQPLDLFVVDEVTEKNSPSEKEIELDGTVIRTSQTSVVVNQIMGNQQLLGNNLDGTSQSSGKSYVGKGQREIETVAFEVASHTDVGQQLSGQNMGDTEMQDCEAEMSVDL